MKMISLHKLAHFLPFTFSGNKRQILKCLFSQDDKRLFSIAENGMLLMWLWTSERSEGAENQLKFQELKMQKRLKLPQGNQAQSPNSHEEALLSSLEREASQGRFLLERKS